MRKTKSKFFITADVEAPHRSFYTEADEADQALGFGGVWSRAESGGAPPKGCLYFDKRADADNAKRLIQEVCRWEFSETIEVTEIVA